MQEIILQYPYALFLFLLLPFFLYLRKKTRQKLVFSYVHQNLKSSRPKFLKRYYEYILYTLLYIFLVLSIANIGYSRQDTQEFIESKWIVLALDVSGSMKRTIGDGKTLEELALEGMEKFIWMRGSQDLIGLVGFSSTAKVIVPPTFDKEILSQKIELLRQKGRFYRELSAGSGTNAPEAIWRALTSFLAMLPEKHRLSSEEILDLRSSLLGSTQHLIDVPEKLTKASFGRGMAVIVFTDGRIEPSQRVHGTARNVPNLINTINLMRRIGVKLYIISVGGRIDEAVRKAMKEGENPQDIGQLFVTSQRIDQEFIQRVYSRINRLEANKIISRITVTKRWTRQYFAIRSFPRFIKI